MSEEQVTEERWRALAQEALSIAERLSDATAKRIMLRIAEAYDRLAERAKLHNERKKKLK